MGTGREPAAVTRAHNSTQRKPLNAATHNAFSAGTLAYVGRFVATHPVAVVPASWLRELARLLDVPFEELCRGTVGPAPRD